jgi:hypothetical protein
MHAMPNLATDPTHLPASILRFAHVTTVPARRSPGMSKRRKADHRESHRDKIDSLGQGTPNHRRPLYHSIDVARQLLGTCVARLAGVIGGRFHDFESIDADGGWRRRVGVNDDTGRPTNGPTSRTAFEDALGRGALDELNLVTGLDGFRIQVDRSSSTAALLALLTMPFIDQEMLERDQQK